MLHDHTKKKKTPIAKCHSDLSIHLLHAISPFPFPFLVSPKQFLLTSGRLLAREREQKASAHRSNNHLIGLGLTFIAPSC
ncbi:hypothetical protein EUGRSUZ_F04400 [Eucalyptus grandis]|uniref:Uncharacterized protein n=2 Tax=Eucalyptus grandis TaxID=71139 RepID=A0ACC3KPT1_EUCGR|nr:hypothetical protein EUGRSUZ_F04400 [Eucalyptus grandis]